MAEVITTYASAMAWGAAGAFLVKPGMVLLLSKNLSATTSAFTSQLSMTDMRSTVKMLIGGALGGGLLLWIERQTPNLPMFVRVAEVGAGAFGSLYLVPTLESIIGYSI